MTEYFGGQYGSVSRKMALLEKTDFGESPMSELEVYMVRKSGGSRRRHEEFAPSNHLWRRNISSAERPYVPTSKPITSLDQEIQFGLGELYQGQENAPPAKDSGSGDVHELMTHFTHLQIGRSRCLVPIEDLSRLLIAHGESFLKSPLGPNLMDTSGYKSISIGGTPLYYKPILNPI